MNYVRILTLLAATATSNVAGAAEPNVIPGGLAGIKLGDIYADVLASTKARGIVFSMNTMQACQQSNLGVRCVLISEPQTSVPARTFGSAPFWLWVAFDKNHRVTSVRLSHQTSDNTDFETCTEAYADILDELALEGTTMQYQPSDGERKSVDLTSTMGKPFFVTIYGESRLKYSYQNHRL